MTTKKDFVLNHLSSVPFLLPMNKVNKVIDLVISKKKIYRFSGRIRTFYRRKTYFYEKNSVALPSAVIFMFFGFI
jgi:hypothetical protein